MKVFLRSAFVAIVVALLVAVGVHPAQAAVEHDTVHSLTSQIRQTAGLTALIRDSTLDAAAQEWANEMSRTNSLVHSSDTWRAARIPAGWNSNGENIAYGFSSANAVMDAWMASSGHRANILRSSFTRLGVGYNATGNFWVQLFAGYSSDALVPFSSTPAPVIAGATNEGSTLSVSTPAWTPTITSMTQQWYVNQIPVPGATNTTFTLRSVDVGSRVTVVVTGIRSGYVTTAVTSAATSKVKTTRIVNRITGADRFTTAVEISKQLFVTTQPSTVYVATGMNYPDSLVAGSVASREGSPVLLVAQNFIPDSVSAELSRLRPNRIVIVGGTPSVSASVESTLRSLAPVVDRITGLDRFGTSRALARAAFPNGAPTAYIVTGNNFPDGLLAAAPAALAGAPVIMVNGGQSTLDPSTSQLLRDLLTQNVVIVGGLPSVSAGIEAGIRAEVASVVRQTGNDRWGTSVAITRGTFSTAQSGYLATGENFPDALAGAVLAADSTSPMMISPGACVPRATLTQLDAMGTRNVTLFGDAPSLSADVQQMNACNW